MRIALDTSILVRAYSSPGGPAARLLSVLCARKHVIVTSEYIVEELRRVLSYPRIRARSGMDAAFIDGRLAELWNSAAVAEPEVEYPVILADPKDDPVLYTAVAGKADVLCTLDRHFFTPDVLAFCAERGIRVMKDVDLLRELLGGEAEAHSA